MEWLNQLALNPNALGNLIHWLKSNADTCSKQALDVPQEAIPVLRGERNCYLSIVGYINNNVNQSIIKSIPSNPSPLGD